MSDDVALDEPKPIQLERDPRWREQALRDCMDLLLDATPRQCAAALPLIRMVVKQNA